MRISSGAVNLSQLHAVYNPAAARLIALDGMMHACILHVPLFFGCLYICICVSFENIHALPVEELYICPLLTLI